MKGLKRIFTLLLVLCMVAATLVSCSSGGNESKNDSNEGESTAETKGQDSSADNTSEEAPYEIVMAYVTIGFEPQDLALVEKAVSDYCLEKINCTVKFKPVAITDLNSQYTLWSSSREKVDLLMMFMMDLGSYVKDGSIVSVEEYLADSPNITRISESSPFLSGGYYNNTLYAVPIVNPSTGQGRAYYVRTDLLNEIDYTEKDLYDYEDLDAIMSQIKEKHPEMVIIGRTGKQTNTYSTNLIPCDTLGVSSAMAGVLMDKGMGDTTVENLFASEEYKTFLEWQKKWYDAGYISSDAATTSDQASDWVKAGRCAGFAVGDDTPGNKENQEASTGYAMTQLNIKPTFVTTETYNQLRWCISSSSERPDKAMAYLDLMYAEGGEMVDMIMNGLEGVHYVRTAEGSKIIDFAEGLDGTNTPYMNLLGIYGDKREMSMFVPNEDSFYTLSEEYTANALKSKSKALGYSFVSDDYSTEMAAVSGVLSQYMDTLEYGMVSNLESAYSEFIDALEDAGIQKLIDANQEQLDAWLAEQ